MKKDVQRTFVLLRQLYSGRESGYARAETRDGKVNLNLVVQGFAPGEEPGAFAVTESGLLYIGPLNMDSRGQGGIAAQLSLSEFREIQVLFVAYMDGCSVMVPLAGTVGRGCWVDWTKVCDEVDAVLNPHEEEAPKDDSPAPAKAEAPAAAEETPESKDEEDCEPPQGAAQEAPAEEPRASQTEEAVAEPEEPAPRIQAEEPSPSAGEEQPAPRVREAESARPAKEEKIETQNEAVESCLATPAEGVRAQDAPAGQPRAAAKAAEQSAPQNAVEGAQRAEAESAPAQEEIDLYDQPAQEDPFELVERSLRTPLPSEQRLEIPEKLSNAYWPQVLWPLHDLFERFEQSYPFGEGESDTVYIRVPLGDALREIDHYLIGAKVQNDWVVGVGYLIPGACNQSAPSGMSGYEWKEGYWQSWQFVENE